MPVTLSDAIRRIRSRLNETSPQLWTDTELTDWINDGCRDLARKAEDLLTFDTSIAIVPGVSKYTPPADVIRVHRAEFVPTGSTQTYPIVPSNQQEMDLIWGTNQSTPSSYPQWFVTTGYPGGAGAGAFTIQFFPVPSQGGTVNLFYYKLPYRFLDPNLNPAELAKNVEVVEGWDDLITLYAEWNALRKSRDPRWQEAKQLYDQELDYLINITRYFHDSPQVITTATRVGQPWWLTQAWE